MKEYIKTINKYALLIITPDAFGMIWSFLIKQTYADINNPFINYLRERIYNDLNSIVLSIPIYIETIFKLIIIGILIADFKKYHLKNIILTSIAAFFFPILGVVMFSILLFLKDKEENNQLN